MKRRQGGANEVDTGNKNRHMARGEEDGRAYRTSASHDGGRSDRRNARMERRDPSNDSSRGEDRKPRGYRERSPLERERYGRSDGSRYWSSTEVERKTLLEIEERISKLRLEEENTRQDAFRKDVEKEEDRRRKFREEMEEWRNQCELQKKEMEQWRKERDHHGRARDEENVEKMKLAIAELLHPFLNSKLKKKKSSK